jgi:hypothetical protein
MAGNNRDLEDELLNVLLGNTCVSGNEKNFYPAVIIAILFAVFIMAAIYFFLTTYFNMESTSYVPIGIAAGIGILSFIICFMILKPKKKKEDCKL